MTRMKPIYADIKKKRFLKNMSLFLFVCLFYLIIAVCKKSGDFAFTLDKKQLNLFVKIRNIALKV